MIKVNVFDLVGENAVSMKNGSKLNDAISASILDGEIVEIDFSGVSIIASPFFNSSIGLLLKDISIVELKERLKIVNCNRMYLDLLNIVIENSIKHYIN